jgi:hypothetical protein
MSKPTTPVFAYESLAISKPFTIVMADVGILSIPFIVLVAICYGTGLASDLISEVSEGKQTQCLPSFLNSGNTPPQFNESNHVVSLSATALWYNKFGGGEDVSCESIDYVQP